MNIISLAMNKKIVFAVGVIAFVSAVAIAGTGAFFSDSAASTANVFSSGTLDLQLSNSTNGSGGYADTVATTWNFSNMVPGGDSVSDTVWLKNAGSVDGLSVGLSMDNAAASVPGMGKQLRITEMTLDGKNLLEGGAGASINEYEEPTTCTQTVTPGGLVAAVTGAVSGDILCVDTGSYNPGTLAVTADNVTIVALHAPDSADKASITGMFDVTADNVTIRGFDISNPSGSYGVSAHSGAQGLTVADNIIHDIGTSLSEGSAQAISVQNGAAGGTGYVFTQNRLHDIGNTSLIKGAGSGSSAKGIYLGDTAATGVLDDVLVENNEIYNIFASTLPWNGNFGGRGAYGVLTNVNAGVTNLVVKNNSIYNLDGLWSHAVGLEKLTTGASVTYNDIYDIVNHKIENDSVAVMIESNTGVGIVIQHNNFPVAFGVVQATAGGSSVNAKKNWWGDFDPSDQVATAGPSINTTEFAGGPIAGFVNGADFNGNGYADFQDLNNDPIIGSAVSLDGGEKKQFVMAVQLDGPTTGNEFQGASFTTDFVFELNQI